MKILTLGDPNAGAVPLSIWHMLKNRLVSSGIILIGVPTLIGGTVGCARASVNRCAIDLNRTIDCGARLFGRRPRHAFNI